MSFSAVSQVWDEVSFREHIRANATQIKRWAKGVTLHHTASPNLAQRPKGWTVQHMRNLAHFYGKKLRWSSGPHFFTDEDQVFGLSPVTSRGVHARSFNANYIGIEALGNFDTESFDSGRGLEVWRTTAAAVAVLLDELGWTESNINFHRDDPKTSKTCPGKKVTREWFLNLVRESRTREPSLGSADVNSEARSENQGTQTPKDRFLSIDKEVADQLLTIKGNIEWQLKKLAKLLQPLTS